MKKPYEIITFKLHTPDYTDNYSTHFKCVNCKHFGGCEYNKYECALLNKLRATSAGQHVYCSEATEDPTLLHITKIKEMDLSQFIASDKFSKRVGQIQFIINSFKQTMK